jgi:hypothetical protein
MRRKKGTLANDGLGFLDMFMSEQKLAIQVAQVNGVKIDNMNLAESRQD